MMNHTEPTMSPPPVPIATEVVPIFVPPNQLARVDFVEMNTALWSGEPEVPLIREPDSKATVEKRINIMSNMISDINERSIDRANKRFHKRMPDGYYIQDDCWNNIKSFLLKPDWKPRVPLYKFDELPTRFCVNHIYYLNVMKLVMCIKKTPSYATFQILNTHFRRDNNNENVILVTQNKPVLDTFRIKIKKTTRQFIKYVKEVTESGHITFNEIQYSKKCEWCEIDKEVNGTWYSGFITSHKKIVCNQKYSRNWTPMWFPELSVTHRFCDENVKRVTWGSKWKEGGFDF